MITMRKLLLASVAYFSFFQIQAAELVWSNVTTEPILTSPVVAEDGSVYFASYDRYVYGLNRDGSLKWSTNLPPPIYIYFATYTGVYGTPALGPNGTLYVPSENGKLLAINTTNGDIKWSFDTPAVEGLYSSVAVAPEGTAYFGSYDLNLYAINPDGTQKWATSLGSTIFSSPVVGLDGTVYCGNDDGKIYSINPDSGATNWVFDTGPNPIAAAPAIGTNGDLHVGVNSAGNPAFYSINTNGTTNWVFTAGGKIRSSAAIAADGTIYFGCDDNKLYALNPNGSKKWDFTAGGPISSSPAIASDGSIYFGCEDGKLYAVDSNGNGLWDYQTGDYVFASPTIGPDGSIYFASADGLVYVLSGCNSPMVSAWPVFRHDSLRTGRATEAGTNLPPILSPLASWTVAPGESVVFTNVVTDPNGPAQQLTYSLGLGAPITAAVDGTNGVFTWTPTLADAPNTYQVRVVVADDGFPPMTDVECFSVTVDSRPHIQSISVSNDAATVIWKSIPSSTYRVQYKTNLADLDWSDIPGDVIATSNTATNVDLLNHGVLTRFYRVALLP